MPWTDRRNPAATKPHEVEARRRRATKLPNNDEARTDGIREADSASNATRRQQWIGSSAKRRCQFSGARPADEKLPDVEMDGEDSCEAQTGGDDHGSGCVRTGGPRRRLRRGCRDTTNLGGMSGVSTTDEDVAAPEVTEELNRLKLLGRQ